MTDPVRAMLCPKCDGQMVTRQRTGVYIEQCTVCSGIFLDRGELRLLARAEVEFHDDFAAAPPTRGRGSGHDTSHDTGHDTGHGGEGHHGQQGRRRRSFLENLFD